MVFCLDIAVTAQREARRFILTCYFYALIMIGQVKVYADLVD
nr:MAG TPA: hypothetical protein [Caudoviricetes sp.]